MSGNEKFEWNKAGKYLLIIVNAILLVFGLGWMIIGAVILGSILLDSDVNTILNTITVLSGGLGDNIKILSAVLIVIGVLIILNAVLGVILGVLYEKETLNSKLKIMLIMYFIIGIVFIVLTIVVLVVWILGTKISPGQMVVSLHTYFTEDAIGSSEISNSWTRIYMKLDCCAVNAVESTTNDFDLTPWCTTSGECQQTNSQIPKTCCKGVTESTYSSAPSSCHANVDSGTYNAKGCCEVLQNEKEPYSSAVISFGVLLLITEILAVILAILLYLKRFCTDSTHGSLKDLCSRICKQKENKVAVKKTNK